MRKREREGYSLPVERRRRDMSAHEENARGEGDSLPVERTWRHVRTPRQSERARGTHSLLGAEGQVRAPRESESAGETHSLSSADRGASQDTKRK
jgi:hypothetical protein